MVAIDLESTGLDPVHDRILSLGIVPVCPATWTVGQPFEYLFNPGVPIPAEATKVHGITNEQVIHCPSFQELAHSIFDQINGKDLIGFNMLSLDLPMLWCEFERCGIEWEPLNCNILDAGTLFKKREERTLSAAVQFYLGKQHGSAHTAGGDALATAEVFVEQLKRYGLQGKNANAIEAETLYGRPLDVAGKIVIDPSNTGDGTARFAFGQKTRGVAVVDDIGFAEWCLRKDFHPHTKQILRRIISESYQPDLGENDWALNEEELEQLQGDENSSCLKLASGVEAS